MGDSYQAIYEAARRAIGHVDAQGALSSAFDISHQKQIALDIFSENAYRVGEQMSRPSVVYRAQVVRGVDCWVCSYGEVCGTGKTPEEAAANFDKKWKEG